MRKIDSSPARILNFRVPLRSQSSVENFKSILNKKIIYFGLLLGFYRFLCAKISSEDFVVVYKCSKKWLIFYWSVETSHSCLSTSSAQTHDPFLASINPALNTKSVMSVLCSSVFRIKNVQCTFEEIRTTINKIHIKIDQPTLSIP